MVVNKPGFDFEGCVGDSGGPAYNSYKLASITLR